MKRNIYFFLAYIFLIALAACNSEQRDNPGETPGGGAAGGEVSVVLTLDLPSPGIPTTYGMSEEDENKISTADILAFKQVGGVEYFAYRAQATLIEDTNESNQKKITVKLQVSDDLHRFVVLANARSEVNALGDIAVTGEKDEVLARLLHTHTGYWDISQPIPMWGESSLLPITETTSQISGLSLLRMVSRIDVITAVPRDSFELQEIYIHNHSLNGHMVPHPDNLENTEKVARATLPEQLSVAAAPYVYQASDSAHIGEIYAYEAPAYNVHEEATCLVIGGSYKGKPTTYYRVDFIDPEGNYLELLRNHIYTFKITAVGGEGYEEEEDAFKSKSVNMTVEVVKWDQGDMQDFVFDGQYILGVSKSLVEFDIAAAQDVVIVTTDYPQGWVATVDKEKYPWLSIVSQHFSGINQKDDLVIGVLDNNSGAARTGYIDVTAGRLTHSIKVVQGITSSASLSILDGNDKAVSAIEFITYLGQSSITPQLFKAVWTPASSDCVITEAVTGRTGFDCGSGDNPAASLTIQGGSKSYNLQPDPITEAELDLSENGDPFLLKQSRYTFTVGELQKHIVVGEQVVGVFAYPAAAYPIDGGTYSYKVKSNVAWTARLVDGGIVQSITNTAGGPNTAGEDFPFKMVTSSSGKSNPATVIYTFTVDGVDVEVPVYINGLELEQVGEANAYIVKPGNGVEIPVSQANKGETTQITNGMVLTPELIWTDHAAGMSANGAVSSIAVDGTGPAATLKVITGSSEGNTVIALRDGSGTIVWSWHIWVTNYDPDHGGTTYPVSTWTFMDRNLGALNGGRSDTNTAGLLYQWGRKDPFPGIEKVTSAAERSIYSASGGTTTIHIEEVSVNNNLLNAIENPKTFYTGSSANFADWYGLTYQDRNDQLWGAYEVSGTYYDNGKTAYDPCPRGWRVPLINPQASPWWNVGLYGIADPEYVGVYAEAIGFWPIPGVRSPITGHIESASMSPTKQQTVYWYSFVNGNSGYGLEFVRNGTSVTPDPNANQERAT
ncbi:MAG: hypothetical protein LUD74_00980, partial [Tannerellaceae bacterium]|nr:hypothetical protein [Tannerellaceae bacterium]